jgi:hypothetical protein
MSKQILEEAGILVHIADAATIGMNALLGDVMGHVKLQVPQPAAARAIAILEASNAAEDSSRSEELPDSADLACLACGKPLDREDSRCSACGWTYENE